MIRLNRIIINGFKNRDRIVDLTFSKEPITVIFGENGCGKSTLLKLLFAIFEQDEQTLKKENVQEIELSYTINSLDSVDDERIQIRYNNENEKYDWLGLGESFDNLNSVFFGIHRGLSSTTYVNPEVIRDFIELDEYESLFNLKQKKHVWYKFSRDLSSWIELQNRRRRKLTISNLRERHLLFDKIDMNSIEDLLSRKCRIAQFTTSKKIQNALFDTLSIAINPNDNNLIVNSFSKEELMGKITSNQSTLIEALLLTSANPLRDRIIEILENVVKEPSEFRGMLDNNNILAGLMFRLIRELEKGSKVLHSINAINKIFNDHISGKKQLIINSEEAYIDLVYTRHSLNELSSGEKQLLTFLTIALLEGSDRNFIIIDEPELSLNMKWQREILPLLSELAPNAQIIVASHSPSIVAGNTNYLVKLEE